MKVRKVPEGSRKVPGAFREVFHRVPMQGPGGGFWKVGAVMTKRWLCSELSSCWGIAPEFI